MRLRDNEALKPVAFPLKLSAVVVVATASAAAALVTSSGASSSYPIHWATPATVTGCGSSSPAQVGFPASSPTTPTGPGAIVCADRTGELALAPLFGDQPATIRPLSTVATTRYTAPFAITTTGSGRIVVAGSIGRGATLTEGRATSSTFSAPVPLGGPSSPLALGRAYLGDTAVASLVNGAIAVRVQRHFQAAFGRAVKVSSRRGPITALYVTLDYRSDALVAWEQGGSIWARELRANGRLQPLQRVGASAPHPQLQAVVSDDNRAIVSWASSVGAATQVWMSISAPLVRFGARPQLLEAFLDPSAARLPDGSLRMTRLSTEGVLIAWTGEEAGRHVVRAAAVGLDGVKPVATISDSATDSVLSDVAPGPHGDAVAIWTATAPASRVIAAARGVVGAAARATFGPPEAVAALDRAGGAVSVAIDPGSDMAIAVWRSARGIAYAQRLPGA